MPVGALVKGKVTKITAFGAFVELESGIEGLIHVTELSDQPFGKVEDVVSKGDEVTAKVIKLDPEHKKIALSIKEYMIDQNQFNRDDIVMTSGRRRKKKEKDKDEEKEEHTSKRNKRKDNEEDDNE